MTTLLLSFVRRRAAWLAVVLAVLSVSVALQAAARCNPRIFNRVKAAGGEARFDLHKALVRLEEIKSQFDPKDWNRLGLECLDVVDPNAVTQVTILDLIKVTNNGSVSNDELARVFQSLNRLRPDAELKKPLLPGLLTKSGEKDGSSAWIVAADNRGHFYEVAAADYLIRTGEIDRTKVVGFGLRIQHQGKHLLEGDTVAMGPTGLMRFYDAKARDGNWSTDELDRAYEALDNTYIEEFVFAYENGSLPSSSWISHMNSLNARLKGRDLRIRLIQGGPFP